MIQPYKVPNFSSFHFFFYKHCNNNFFEETIMVRSNHVFRIICVHKHLHFTTSSQHLHIYSYLTQRGRKCDWYRTQPLKTGPIKKLWGFIGLIKPHTFLILTEKYNMSKFLSMLYFYVGWIFNLP